MKSIEKKSQIRNSVIWVGFVLTFMIHLIIWTQVEQLAPKLLIQFYLFLSFGN